MKKIIRAQIPTLASRLLAAKREGWASWIKSERDERAVANGCRFDLKTADRINRFFPSVLRHSKGEWAGKPFQLLDWQRDDLICPLFAWLRIDGARRYSHSYIQIGKKNGKSTIAAGVALYLMIADCEPGAHVYSMATDIKQACLVHNEAISMVESSPALSRVLLISKSSHTIAFPATRSFYTVLSREIANKEGIDAHGIIADELHVWRGRKVWDAIAYAFRARRQGLLFAITTAGDDELSICHEQFDYAQGVIKGDIQDERFFPFIAAAEKSDDPMAPATWKKANPSLGLTINVEQFAADAKAAQASPAAFISWKRYSLNIWATSTNPWLHETDWDQCRRPFTEADLLGRDCWGGLDLAKTRDMTAFVLVFPWPEDDPPAAPPGQGETAAGESEKPRGCGTFRILPFFWMPDETARSNKTTNPYAVWADQGHLRLTPGNVCDYAFVRRDIGELSKKFRIRDFRFDPYNAEQLTNELAEQFDLKRLAFGQTIQNFAGPTSEFERLVIAGRMHHPGNPILTWQSRHVRVRIDFNANKRPVKPAPNDPRKIDGIVAGIMGLAGQMNPSDKLGGRSVYDQRGIIAL